MRPLYGTSSCYPKQIALSPSTTQSIGFPSFHQKFQPQTDIFPAHAESSAWSSWPWAFKPEWLEKWQDAWPQILLLSPEITETYLAHHICWGSPSGKVIKRYNPRGTDAVVVQTGFFKGHFFHFIKWMSKATVTLLLQFPPKWLSCIEILFSLRCDWHNSSTFEHKILPCDSC